MKKVTRLLQLTLFLLLISFNQAFSQNVAINTTGGIPDASAMLDIASTSKGFLIPRVSLTSLTDATTVTSTATSLLIYNTNAAITNGKGYYFNNGTSGSPSWVKLVIVDATGIVQSTTPGGEVIKLERFPMGEVSMNGNTSVTALTNNVWTKAAGTTAFSGGSYQFTNGGGTNNKLVYTGTSMKMFHIACTLSVKSTNDAGMKAVLFKNGVALTTGIVQTKMFGTDVQSTAIHVMTTLSPNDYLELYIMNISNNNDLTVTEMNMFAMGVSMGMD